MGRLARRRASRREGEGVVLGFEGDGPEIGRVRRRVRAVALALAVLGSLLGSLTILHGRARAAILYVGGSGPGNYTTIQAAAGAAQTGDTIFVFGGTYMEGPFDLGFGVSLVGEDRATTIIETSNPIRMAGWSNISSVTIQGFAVQRVLWLWFADHASIADTAIYASMARIFINSTGGGTLRNNPMPAVSPWSAPGPEIPDNRLDRNSVGVHVVASSNNTVANNTVPNGLGAGVVFDTYSDDNVAANNTVANATFGIYSSFASDRTTVMNNTISGCQDGILLTGTGDRIVGNTVNGSRYTGIEESGTDDVIARKTVYSNIEAGVRPYSTPPKTGAGHKRFESYQGNPVRAPPPR